MRQHRVDRRFWLAACALVVVVLGLYGRTALHGFVNFDDPLYVSRQLRW